LAILKSEVNRAEEALSRAVQTGTLIAGMAVYGGLFGTLLGLSTGVAALPRGNTLNPSDFANQVSATLGGFGGAFHAALAGVLATILLGLLLALYQSRAITVLHAFEDSGLDLVRSAWLVRDPADGRILSPAEMFRRETEQLLLRFSKKLEEMQMGSAQVAAEAVKAATALAQSVGVFKAMLKSELDAATNALQSAGSVATVASNAAENARDAADAARKWHDKAADTFNALGDARDFDTQVASLAHVIAQLSTAVEAAPGTLKAAGTQLEAAVAQLATLAPVVQSVLVQYQAQETRFREAVRDQLAEFEEGQRPVFEKLNEILSLHRDYVTHVSRLIDGMPEVQLKPASDNGSRAPAEPVAIKLEADQELKAEIKALRVSVQDLKEAVRGIPTSLSKLSTGANEPRRMAVPSIDFAGALRQIWDRIQRWLR
jgi:hypothetical protein